MGKGWGIRPEKSRDDRELWPATFLVINHCLPCSDRLAEHSPLIRILFGPLSEYLTRFFAKSGSKGLRKKPNREFLLKNNHIFKQNLW